MRIREDQMAHFAALAKRSFTERMLRHLRDLAPDEVAALTDSALRGHIEASMDQARDHDITMESDVATFIVMLAYLGWDAPGRVGWLRTTLRERELDGSGKIRTLLAAYEAMGSTETAASPEPTEEEQDG